MLYTVVTTTLSNKLTIEIVINNNGTEQQLQNAINQIGSSQGTISFQANISISTNFTVPGNITLNFYGGSLINIIGFGSIKIYGPINSKPHQIFDVQNSHGVTIYNEEILPEWFGVCTYQVVHLAGPPLYNDDVVIQLPKTLTTIMAYI